MNRPDLAKRSTLSENFYVADITDWDMIMGYDFMVGNAIGALPHRATLVREDNECLTWLSTDYACGSSQWNAEEENRIVQAVQAVGARCRGDRGVQLTEYGMAPQVYAIGSGLFSVPLELSGRKESGLRYASKTNYRTENYQLARHVLENGLAALQVILDEIQAELFASQQQHIMQLYCSKQLNNAFRFFWKAMGLAYANPPFSLLAKVLTKIAYEGGRVVMCTPDWGCSGEPAYSRRMLDLMTVGRVQLPDGPIYVPEDSDTAMQAPEWASFLSIVDGSLNPVPLCDLDQVLLKEVMAENRGLTL